MFLIKMRNNLYYNGISFYVLLPLIQLHTCTLYTLYVHTYGSFSLRYIEINSHNLSNNFLVFFFFFLHRYEIYNLQFKSDGSMRRMSIDGPNTGDWYAVAFISWTDPNNDRIEQQGKPQKKKTTKKS